MKSGDLTAFLNVWELTLVGMSQLPEEHILETFCPKVCSGLARGGLSPSVPRLVPHCRPANRRGAVIALRAAGISAPRHQIPMKAGWQNRLAEKAGEALKWVLAKLNAQDSATMSDEMEALVGIALTAANGDINGSGCAVQWAIGPGPAIPGDVFNRHTPRRMVAHAHGACGYQISVWRWWTYDGGRACADASGSSPWPRRT